MEERVFYQRLQNELGQRHAAGFGGNVTLEINGKIIPFFLDINIVVKVFHLFAQWNHQIVCRHTGAQKGVEGDDEVFQLCRMGQLCQIFHGV